MSARKRKPRRALTAEESEQLARLIAIGRQLTTQKLMLRFDVCRGVINRAAQKSKSEHVPHETIAMLAAGRIQDPGQESAACSAPSLGSAAPNLS